MARILMVGLGSDYFALPLTTNAGVLIEALVQATRYRRVWEGPRRWAARGTEEEPEALEFVIIDDSALIAPKENEVELAEKLKNAREVMARYHSENFELKKKLAALERPDGDDAGIKDDL